MTKEIEFFSLNMAGWKWTATEESWESRLNKECEYIKSKINNTLVIALQEVQLSGGKYLEIFEKHFPDYHIVLPKGYKKEPRAVISMLLINKELCTSFSIATLEGIEDSLRYNFVTLSTTVENGLCFRIINTNIPHKAFNENTAEWYKEERKDLRTLFINNIKKLAKTYRSEPDVKFMVMGDFNTTPEDEFIESLAYTYDRTMIDRVEDKNKITWKNQETLAKNRLDYILYSTGMLYNTYVKAEKTEIDDNTIAQKLSDHALIIGRIKTGL